LFSLYSCQPLLFNFKNLEKMGIFTKTYEVMPFYQGFLFRNNTFEKQLNAGFHEIYD